MWYSSTENLKDMCGSLHIEMGGDIQPDERNMIQRAYNICPQTKQKKVKVKREETLRNLKRLWGTPRFHYKKRFWLDKQRTPQFGTWGTEEF